MHNIQKEKTNLISTPSTAPKKSVAETKLPNTQKSIMQSFQKYNPAQDIHAKAENTHRPLGKSTSLSEINTQEKRTLL